jgi:hypothetical protein
MLSPTRLPHDPDAGRAKRNTDRELLLALEGARQQQVGDVGAGDQQYEANPGKKREKRWPHAADRVIMQVRQRDPEALICGGVFTRQLVCNGFQF